MSTVDITRPDRPRFNFIEKGRAETVPISTNGLTNILDCTFRDGGYYTNWSFPDELVRDYLATMAELPISAIELGYAGKAKCGGQFANVDNNAARALRPRTDVMLAVMLDAKDYLDCGPELEIKLDGDLGQRVQGGLDAIRIAVHFRAALQCGPLIDALDKRGYRVFLNLMQVDLASAQDIQNCRAFVASMPCLEAVYVADSLGAMRPERVVELVTAFAGPDADPVGFHAHDNSGLAIANTLSALSRGCAWLDSTVAGMGRGAGNASTEQLLNAVALPGYTDDAARRLQHLVSRHFDPMKRAKGWGHSPLYQAGAALGLHPTFVQEVQSDPALTTEQALQWINAIPPKSSGFDRKRLETARAVAFADQAGPGKRLEEVA